MKRAPKITREAALAWVNRPWHLFEEAHADWARARHQRDASKAFERAEELWRAILAAGRYKGRLKREHRREDFEHHQRLRALLDRT